MISWGSRPIESSREKPTSQLGALQLCLKAEAPSSKTTIAILGSSCDRPKACAPLDGWRRACRWVSLCRFLFRDNFSCLRFVTSRFLLTLCYKLRRLLNLNPETLPGF